MKFDIKYFAVIVPVVQGNLRHTASRLRTAGDNNSLRFKILQDEQSTAVELLREQETQLEVEQEDMAELLEVMETFGNALSMPGIPAPTRLPSGSPTLAPSHFPSDSPTSITEAPTESGILDNSTEVPSEQPSPAPTDMPSIATTSTPSFSPSAAPSISSSPTTATPTISVAPTSSPTLDGCGITAAERRAEIIEILGQVANATLLEDLSTPQGQATDWIINEDLRRLCPNNRKIVQRWTLAVMYFSTGGENWLQCFAGDSTCGNFSPFFNRDSFLSPSIECEWAGISCNSETCVTEVEFEDNRLVGTIPTELGLLTDLVIWGMERGNLTGTIPSEMGSLDNLVFIDLDFNQLTGSLPTELYNLVNLTQLDLNNNFLEGDIDGIRNFTGLEFLQLHSNLFTGTIPVEVGDFSALRTFTLHEASFVGNIPEGLCTMVEDGTLISLIADCRGDTPEIVCDCCTDCRASGV